MTIDRRDDHAKGQDQRSKVKVTEAMTPFNRFRFEFTYGDEMMHKAWCCLEEVQGNPSNFKVTRNKNRQFWPKLSVSGL